MTNLPTTNPPARDTSQTPYPHQDQPPDFVIYTDGSCDYNDGIAGHAAIVLQLATGLLLYRGGAETGSSVRRAEMNGLLAGLQTVAELTGLVDPKERKRRRAVVMPMPLVHWYTDRQDLTGATNPAPDGTMFQRDKDADLWARVQWYEQWLALRALRRPRNTVGGQAEADRVAGMLRKMLQSHVLQWKEQQQILFA